MPSETTVFILQAKQATAAQWAARNPRLLFGRVYYDTTNKLVKIGDGLTHYNDAPYAFTGPTGPTGPAGDPGAPGPNNVIAHASPADITNTTDTLADVTGLAWELGANESWNFRLSLDIDGDTIASGITVALAGSTSITQVRLAAWAVDDAAAGTIPPLQQATDTPVTFPAGVAFNAANTGRVWIDANVANGSRGTGTIQLQFAQQIPTDDGTTVKAGSFGIATKNT